MRALHGDAAQVRYCRLDKEAVDANKLAQLRPVPTATTNLKRGPLQARTSLYNTICTPRASTAGGGEQRMDLRAVHMACMLQSR